jgi:hypothetical protein
LILQYAAVTILFVFPAKAAIHCTEIALADEWIPAFVPSRGRRWRGASAALRYSAFRGRGAILRLGFPPTFGTR